MGLGECGDYCRGVFGKRIWLGWMMGRRMVGKGINKKRSVRLKMDFCNVVVWWKAGSDSRVGERNVYLVCGQL